MIRINLAAATGMPAEPRPMIPPHHRGAAWGSLLLAITMMGLGGGWWRLRNEAAALDSQISLQQSELASLTNTITLVDRAIARKSELSQDLGLIDRLRAARKDPEILLLTLSRSLPDGLWLIELKQQGPVVQIEGRATSLTVVTDFLDRLQNSGVFDRSIEIVSTGTELIDDSSVIRFAVKAQRTGT
jgi:Tfp pilus assembly protein PilN